MNIKELEYTTNIFDDSILYLEITGENTHYETINAIRKTCASDIPIYSFHPINIKYGVNTTIHNSTDLNMKLSQLPIRNIHHNIDYLEPMYYQGFNFNDNDIPIHVNDTYRIEYYLKIKNETNSIKRITENDIIKRVNDIIVSDIIEQPIEIIKLKPQQELEVSMKAVLSIGKVNSIFNASHCYYDEIDENKFILKIESLKQLTEYEILMKSCIILIEKFRLIHNTINNNKNIILENDDFLIINMDNENLTTFGVIKYFLLKSDKVLAATATINNGFLIENVTLKVKTNKNIRPLDEVNKAIDLSIELYTNLSKKIEKLHKSAKIKIIN